MDARKISCLCAAGLIGSLLITAASAAEPRQSRPDLVVKAPRIDAATQRKVSYADLNLALQPGQKVLKHRIFVAANGICNSINSNYTAVGDCLRFAVDKTRPQVKAAIRRAELRMASGRPAAKEVTDISLAIAAR